MGELLSKENKLGGIKVYYGVDDKGNNIGIVLGINEEGKDVIKEGDIQSIGTLHLGPCPPVCDASSPISKN